MMMVMKLRPEVVEQRHDGFYFTCSIFMWQFLYFLPLPQGQGSLRPTFAPTLRIVSIFFGDSPLLVAKSVIWA